MDTLKHTIIWLLFYKDMIHWLKLKVQDFPQKKKKRINCGFLQRYNTKNYLQGRIQEAYQGHQACHLEEVFDSDWAPKGSGKENNKNIHKYVVLVL